MENVSLFAPPLALAIVVAAAALLSLGLARLAFKPKQQAGGTTKPYACGEDLPAPQLQPDYGEFLPFAFFFTILHVVALAVATVPVGNAGALAFAVVYVVGALVGLLVLFRS